MMMALRSFFLLFSLVLLPLALGDPCEPCGDSQYEMTTPGATFDAGVERMSCRDLVSIAGDRRKWTDVCYLVVNYALEYCNCKNDNNDDAPDLPYYDSTQPCNICGGTSGSDLYTIDQGRLERNVPTSLGISVKCDFLFQTALQGAFLPSQCSDVQDATREACGCGLHDPNDPNHSNHSGASFGSPSLWYAVVLLELTILALVW